MNERIKQLAEQAGLTDYMVFGRIESKEDVLRNFAESIIRECIAVVDECNLVDDDPIANIKEHFGVER